MNTKSGGIPALFLPQPEFPGIFPPCMDPESS